MKKYLHTTITEMHEALVKGLTTPLELTLEAIKEAKENADNAFEIILEDEAVAYARTLTVPEPGNPFWGIPFVAKDNFSTKGIETTAGSNSLVGYVPVYDATVIKKLADAKAVMIGKSAMDELAMGGTGMTGHKGRQYNPYDPGHTRIIGGSSSGSAVAVTSGIVPFALGSDTGDSVRRPASFGGIVGFKPTWGKISRYGLFPFTPSMDHVAYFTRSVTDAALVTNLLSGKDEMDMTSFPTGKINIEALDDRQASYKVAVIKEIYQSGRDAFVKEAFDGLIGKFAGTGIKTDVVNFDRRLLEALYPVYITISCAEATSNNANIDGIKFGPRYWGESYADMMMKARTEGFSELIKRRFIIGSYALLKENQDEIYLRAQKGRRMIVDELAKILSEYDFILVPATPSIAPEFTDGGDRLASDYLIANNHLGLANLAGLPSLSVPLGYKDGMPFGVSITGRAFEEEKVLHFGKMIEDLTGLKNAIAFDGAKR